MLAAFISFYDRNILRHPLLSIGLVLLLVAALASQLGQLKLDASADSLVLEGDADLEFFRENSAHYSTEEFLVVTYQPFGDLLADESLNVLRQLRDELAQVQGVSSTTTILDVPLLQSPPVPLSAISSDEGLPTLLDPGIDRELVREEFRISPIYAQLLVSPDGRTTAIQINLQRDQRYTDMLELRESLRAERATGSLTPLQRDELALVEKEFKAYSSLVSERQALMVEQVRSIVAGYRDHARLFVGGVPMIAADMVSFVRSDLVTFGAGIILFMVVVLAIIFRALRWVVLPIFTCVAAAALCWVCWRRWTGA